jgi:hypothetical protein
MWLDIYNTLSSLRFLLLIKYNSMASYSSELIRLNAEKSLVLASTLFPLEEWIPHGKNIFVFYCRLTGGHKEQAKL